MNPLDNLSKVTAVTQTALLVVGVVLVWYVWRQLKQASSAVVTAGSEALTGAQMGTANVIEKFFPLTNPNAMITYAVRFPDGQLHAVNGEDIDKSGYFYRDGTRYLLAVDQLDQKIAQVAP